MGLFMRRDSQQQARQQFNLRPSPQEAAPSPSRTRPDSRQAAGKLDLESALRLVQTALFEAEVVGEERAAANKRVAEDAMAGVPGAREASMRMVEEFFAEKGVEVEGVDPKKAAYLTYRELWGLGPLEEVYRDPVVNEVQVNAPDRIYALRNLELVPVKNVRFRDDDHVLSVVTRMVMHDRGVSLNRSSPTIESMRRDGTRITATCPPVSEHVTLTLRKHTQRVIPFDEMIQRGVMDAKARDLLRLLVKGRANIAIIGGVGSGKTTLLRTLFGETDPRVRAVVLETDRELFLSKNYPGRNIVELEEHTEVGRALKELFRTTLRYTPTVIIVGEFRGEGEASEAVRACERGHDGSMTTAHFGSAAEFVSGTARMLIKEGLALPQRVLEELISSSFNVVVKMFGDSTRGVIRLEAISELVPGSPPRDLLVWVPDEYDYLKGTWRLVQPPTERLLARLHKYGVPPQAVRGVFR